MKRELAIKAMKREKKRGLMESEKVDTETSL